MNRTELNRTIDPTVLYCTAVLRYAPAAKLSISEPPPLDQEKKSDGSFRWKINFPVQSRA